MTNSAFPRFLRCGLVVLAGAVGCLAITPIVGAQPAAPPLPFGGGAGGAQAPSGELKMLAAVAFTNYDNLTKDLDYIGSLIGQPQLSQVLAGKIDEKTGGKGLAGIDKAKPWGLMVQADEMQFLPVVCLPVTNSDNVLAAIEASGAQLKDGANGMKEFAMAGGTGYLKSANGWVFLSKNPASLTRVPADPAAAFSKLLTNYDFVAHALVQNAPPMYRQLGILAIQSAMQQQLNRQPDETDEEFQARRASIQLQMQQMVQQIQELDTMTLGALIDAAKKQSVIEFTYKFVPGGELSKQFAAYGEPKTNFAGFRRADAAAMVSTVAHADAKTVQKDLAQFEAAISSARTQFNKGIDEHASKLDEAKRAALKKVAGEWFDALAETLKAGQIDGAASLDFKQNSLSLVAGALVQDPAKFENGLKKLDDEFKGSPGFEGIRWKADSHNSVNIHTMSFPVSPEEGLSKLLGDKADLAFGVGPKAIYLAVGKDGVNALKQAIDGSQAEPNKLVSPFEVTLAFAPLLELAAAQSQDATQQTSLRETAKMLRTQSPGRDHVRITSQIVPNGLTYRVEAEDGAMRAIAAKAMEAQQRAQSQKGLEAAVPGQGF